jgi:hypothetical protein
LGGGAGVKISNLLVGAFDKVIKDVYDYPDKLHEREIVNSSLIRTSCMTKTSTSSKTPRFRRARMFLAATYPGLS